METKTERSSWKKVIIAILAVLVAGFVIATTIVWISTPLRQISLSMILTEGVSVATDMAYCLAVIVALIGAMLLPYAVVVLIRTIIANIEMLFRRGK